MPSAFVAMPYSPEYAQVYTEVLRPALLELGFRVLRADEIPASSTIPDDIQRQIQAADLVVVEASELNPNVYYEIGLADAQQKELLLLTQKPASLPFDTRQRRHLAYQATALSELRTEFVRWVKATAAYQGHARRVEGRVLTRGELFSWIFDSTSYVQNPERTTEELLLAEIHDGSLISSKFAYGTEKGTIHWLRLCRHPLYTVYHESISFLSENAAKLLATCGETFITSSPDVISLGPGDGHKDRIILRALAHELDQRQNPGELFYYPMDVSLSMLSTAVHAIHEDRSLAARVKVKAIHGDFAHLSAFLPVFNYRTQPNLFLFLGNTLGNMQNEISFLLQVSKTMYPGDILMLEVRLQTDGLVPGGPEEERRDLAFSPLARLGVPFSPQNIVRELSQQGLSQIQKTRSVVTRMYDVRIGDEILDEVRLACVNFYDRNSLKDALEGSALGFEVLGLFDTPQLSIFVLRKNSKKRSIWDVEAKALVEPPLGLFLP